MPLRWFPVAVSAVVLGWVLLRVVVACAGLPTFQVSDFLVYWFLGMPTFRLFDLLECWRMVCAVGGGRWW